MPSTFPDNHIHPEATGVAKKTVDAHQKPEELVFWSGWFCPFNQRVWIVLEEKGIPYQYKEVNPYAKEESFLKLNPRGLVPTIEFKGKPLYESTVLAEFLEDAYPERAPHVVPKDPYEKARVRIWADHTSKHIIPAWQRLLQLQTKEDQDKARQDLYEAQRKLAEEIKGPYFAGEEFGLVDVLNAPFVSRDHVLQEHRAYKREGAGEKYAQWADLLARRDSVVKTTSEKDKLMVIYDRYLVGEANSEVAKAIREGRPLP